MRSGGIGKRPAALTRLGWPPMPAPMTTAFVLIFPISHPRIVMWGSPVLPRIYRRLAVIPLPILCIPLA